MQQCARRLGGNVSADEVMYTDEVAGAEGLDRVTAELARLARDGVRVLHDRRMPAPAHIAITPGAVWVVSAQKAGGRPQLRVEGRLGRPRIEKLMVGRFDQTQLLARMQARIDGIEARMPDVPVRGALCFVSAPPPLLGAAFGASFNARGVDVVSPGRLGKLLRSTAVGPINVAAAAAQLARLFPPA